MRAAAAANRAAAAEDRLEDQIVEGLIALEQPG